MRYLAPILFGLSLSISIAAAQSPPALQLPPTLHLPTGGEPLEELDSQWQELASDGESADPQLKDFIIGLEFVPQESEHPVPDRGPVEQHFSDLEGLAEVSVETEFSVESHRRVAQRTTVGDIRTSSHDEPAEKRANVQYEGIDLGQPRNGSGPTDQLDDENAFDSGYFNDVDADEARARTAMTYIRELRRPVDTIRIKIELAGKGTPPNQAERYVGQQASTWVTANGVALPLPDRYTIGFSHRPLYYEELDLERCGLQHGCLQYELSGFYFLFNTLVLPYRMATQCPDQLVCSRGDCKSCQYYPTEIEPLVCSKKAFIVEGAALAGFTFLLL